MHQILPIISVFLLTACGVMSHRNPGTSSQYIYEPTQNNNYSGTLIVFSGNEPEALATAKDICASKGGLKSPPTLSYKRTLYDVFGYSCNGPTQAIISSPVTPMVNQQSNALVNPSTGINEAKSKCNDLGFKQGTEGFGKCVLKLSQ